ncbi:hypothetical protein SAMN06295885_0557 [Rathayibacter oskolensis]|uniref:DUF4190 domain-containing protein n=1 Tax=Rathayibacter oskolensis TaxID=1891671 RepID=A0A1X7N318_9MICO|nr:DUF4190 domain-containing protein [Rathayibacter oskolensis]SMH31226.1 hypothetical protein SAMN06295885_0557 [Rathayibacter oskolensis]
MSDSTQPGPDDRQGSGPIPPQPPVPPAPPAPPAPPGATAPTAPSAGAPQYGRPSYGTPAAPAPGAPTPSYAYAPAPVAPPRTLSLVGMILGIAGLVITVFAWGFGFILSAPAVVLGFLGRRREPAARGFALTAIITGFAGILVSLIYLAITIVIFAVAIGAASTAAGS